jgi:hypothetical protein
MPSVFLSYDHEDAGWAGAIASAIERAGHSVWWDRHIHSGAEFNTEIEAAVEQADAVVVLWSERSVRSAWVRDEAAEGRDAGKLVPVLVESVKPPMGFRQFQTLDLTGWSGGKKIPRLAELLQAIDKVAALNVAGAPPAVAQPRSPQPGQLAGGPFLTRRVAVSGGVAAAVAVGGGIWWSTRDRTDPRFKALVEQSEDAIRHQRYDEATVNALKQAVSIHPRNAKAMGLLALVTSLNARKPDAKDIPRLVREAEESARRALAINPKEPNALLAMFTLQGSTLDWMTRDQRLRQIIGIDPGNVTAISEMVLLSQATGMSRESWNWNERALALAPLSVELLGRRALKLWILGKTGEADKVIDQVRALNPNDPWVWWVRFLILAMTGRAKAAGAMLDGNPTMGGFPKLATQWQDSLPALDNPTPDNIEKARAACLRGARAASRMVIDGAVIMAALRQVDTAFEIAHGMLLGQGPAVRRDQLSAAETVQDASWRINTQWMWNPATASMRADSRFLPLCKEIGLTEYWRKRGVRPDYEKA